MQIGVLGSGSMGKGIAQVAATAGNDVILYDNNPTALGRARDDIQRILNRLVEKGKMTDEEAKGIFGRIYFVDSIYDYRDCELVIEA
ncbi:MAG: NAD(P)-binding domain-containing protein, partial [Saprospiraceae bacterium]|nr:NAD(P)-binding domain-containing protein [Saprospiraceae bacterium]